MWIRCACPECDSWVEVGGTPPYFCSQVCYERNCWVKRYGHRVRCLCKRYPKLRQFRAWEDWKLAHRR